MRRLYLQIYLGVVATALLVMLAALALGGQFRPDRDRIPRIVEGFAELAGEEIPGPGASPSDIEASLEALGERLGIYATLWSASGERIAHTGPPIQAPAAFDRKSAWSRGHRQSPVALHVRLDDGRMLSLAIPQRHTPHAIGPGLIGTLVFAAVIGVGAYPISRRITRRLERLRGAVDQLGAGALDARVPVEGRDEVAQLAESFNRSAERVERLVHAQRRVLANASHELRSPLTRLRLSLELMGGGDRPDLMPGAERDIEELDALIDDVLLAARIESGQLERRSENVDLRALLEDEGSRAGARVEAHDAEMRGDPRLLRRMLRNLFENASRHAGGHEVSADLSTLRDPNRPIAYVLRVYDRGPGVPGAERLRIFEPFYRPPGHSEGRDGGVGLGLALVRDIARQHGGDACCLAREGGGSVFEVTLSASPPLPGQAPERP